MAMSSFNPPRIDGGAGPAKAGKKAKPGKPAPETKDEPALRWDDRLSLGVEAIDSQHKMLLGYCNDLVAALRRGEGAKALSATMTRLREYTVQHFADEEAYMQRIGYPELGPHRAAHAGMVQRVKEYQRRLYQHEEVAPAEVRAFLKDWLITHILGEDLKIAAHVRTRDARTAGGEEAVDLVAEPPSRPEGD
jgi:hemerythrin-like metal-binding protein